MKKKSMRIMALVAVVLPMMMLGSCDNDKEEIKPEPEPKEEMEYTPDEAYIRQAWMIYDSTGTMVDTKYGMILDKSTPTIRTMFMDGLQDAKEHFLTVLCPPDAKVSEDGDDMTISLTDTLGVEKNKVFFKTVNDGKTLARVTLEKPIGIEEFLTELRYCSKSADVYTGIDNSCPFHEGRIYYHNGHNYLCIRTAANGNYGILVSDIGKHQNIDTNTNKGSKKATANYPDTGVFEEIQNILKNQNMPELWWQKLAATTSAQSPHSTDEVKFGVSSVPEFKTRIYWTSVVPKHEYIRTWSLVNGNCGDVEPGYYFWSDDTDRYVLSAYEFYWGTLTPPGPVPIQNRWIVYRFTTPYGEYYESLSDKFPSVDSFERNERVEQAAGSIELQ